MKTKILEKAKTEIREMVAYIINVKDDDIINSYSATFEEIMKSYSEQQERETAIEFAFDFENMEIPEGWHIDNYETIEEAYKAYKEKIGKLFDEWKSQDNDN